MFRKLWGDIIRKPPAITLLMVLSCIITTIPQFFLPENYSALVGDATVQNSIFFTLPSFSHDPKILLLHLVLNSSVFLLFGSVIEKVLGKSRYSLITLITFTTSTLLVFFRGTVSHGASGICWGYQTYLIFILIIYFEKNKYKARKDIWVYFYLLFMIFNFIGTPIFETLNGIQFGDNFGQYVHLASTFVTVPLLLMWRYEIENNIESIINSNEAATRKESLIPIIILLCILIYNLFSTCWVLFRFTSPGVQ